MKFADWKLRRLWFLLKYVGSIIVAVAIIGILLIEYTDFEKFGRVLISLDIIVLAWMVVAVSDKVMRNKWVFVCSFLTLMALGVCVYSNQLDKSKDKDTKQQILVDQGTKYLNPIVNTLSIFFPSRGDYEIKESGDYYWYYLLHFLGYFFAAWVLFSLFGKKMISRTLYWIIEQDKINVFWGYSVDGMVLAKDMMTKKKFRQPVFVLPKKTEYDVDEESRIIDELMDFGAIVVHEDFDMDLKIDGARHFFMTERQDDNVSRALRMIDRLEQKLPKLDNKVYLHVRSEIEGIDILFQQKFKDKDYLKKMVEVNLYNLSDLAARSFVMKHPLLDLRNREFKLGDKRLTVHPESATVSGDCHVLLLGLGWSGYEILRKTVGDAQFLGDDFHFSVTVIDEEFEKDRGRYMRIFKIAKKMNIEINVNPTIFLDKNGAIVGEERSGLMEDEVLSHFEDKKRPFDWLEKRTISSVNSYDFYRWLDFNENILNFDRIIVTLGNDELSTNTAMQLNRFRLSHLSSYNAEKESNMPEKIFAYVKDLQSYNFYAGEGSPIETFGDFEKINSVENLVEEKIDKVAKRVNYVYSRYDCPVLNEEQINDYEAMEAAWDKEDTNIFNQNSSRSVALNVKNVVVIAGGEEMFKERIQDPFFLEKYAEMEHKRWNAFNFMYGVDVWEKDDVTASNGKLRFNGTLLAKHICIVDFDELDEMSLKVRSLGNVNENYKETDRRIVRHFPLFYEIMNSKITN